MPKLSVAELHNIRGHARRVSKRALVPGTAFFEMATAAAGSMCSSAEPALGACLTDAAIAAPKLLESGDSLLECKVPDAAGSGLLTVRSADTVHLSCQLMCMQPVVHGGRHTARLALRLLPPQKAAASVQAAVVAAVAMPAACAGVGSRSCFLVHPAAGDASLHLGAVPRSAAGAQEPPPSRVPVSFSAYTASLGELPAGERAFRHR